MHLVASFARNAHQWRRVRYSYMDCRGHARKRGLIILGTRKIWDSSLAASAVILHEMAHLQGALGIESDDVANHCFTSFSNVRHSHVRWTALGVTRMSNRYRSDAKRPALAYMF